MERRRYRDNKSEDNLKLVKLTGKEYKTIINKPKAVHRQKCVESNNLKIWLGSKGRLEPGLT